MVAHRHFVLLHLPLDLISNYSTRQKVFHCRKFDMDSSDVIQAIRCSILLFLHKMGEDKIGWNQVKSIIASLSLSLSLSLPIDNDMNKFIIGRYNHNQFVLIKFCDSNRKKATIYHCDNVVLSLRHRDATKTEHGSFTTLQRYWFKEMKNERGGDNKLKY